MQTEEAANATNAEQSPQAPVALCLSGGGYRAAAFHLGALRRLNETGLLGQVDRVCSVSGGSILAGHLAECMVQQGCQALCFADWEKDVARPFRDRILSKDIRTQPFLKQWGLPWNWFRAGPAVSALEGQYRRNLTRLELKQLPQKPRFTFCSTDLLFGTNFTFERHRSGDYLCGRFASLSGSPVAKAVAASSCFPPVFLPMKMKLPRRATTGSSRPDVVHLSDGGVYDNLGVQPAWSRHPTLLVSDGGAPFEYAPGSTPKKRLSRYVAIASNQGLSVRWQWLLTRFRTGETQGTAWRIGSHCGSYRNVCVRGYSRHFARDAIARIRTDMDGFSPEEIGVLENHGYLMAEAAVQMHMASWLAASTPAASLPFPDLMDEEAMRKALRKSHRRRPLRSMVRFVTHPVEPFRARLRGTHRPAVGAQAQAAGVTPGHAEQDEPRPGHPGG